VLTGGAFTTAPNFRWTNSAICAMYHVQFADWCAPVKISNTAKYSVLQALQFQEVSVHCILPGSPVNLFVIGGQHGRGDVTIAYCCHLYVDVR
jgi:hypothetical protein